MANAAPFLSVLGLVLTLSATAVPQQWETVDVRLLKEQKALSDQLQASRTSMVMVVEFTSFRSKNDVVPHERIVAEVLRDKDRFRSRIGDITTIQAGAVRVVIDERERSMMITDPVALEDAGLAQLSSMVLDKVLSCNRRRLTDGMEYRIQFPPGGVYEFQLIQFDDQGWLRRTETVWRQGIPEDPGNVRSVVHQPRLIAQYGRPAPLNADRSRELDLAKVYRAAGASGFVALAPWSGFQVIDTRFNP
jgi:hypothetical protein